MINLGLKLTSMQFLQPFPNNFFSLRNQNMKLEVFFPRGQQSTKFWIIFYVILVPVPLDIYPMLTVIMTYILSIRSINRVTTLCRNQSDVCNQIHWWETNLKSILSIIIRFLCNNLIQTSSCSVNQSILQWSRSADHWDRFKINQSLCEINPSYYYPMSWEQLIKQSLTLLKSEMS